MKCLEQELLFANYFSKTSGFDVPILFLRISDYLLWYAKDNQSVKFQQYVRTRNCWQIEGHRIQVD